MKGFEDIGQAMVDNLGEAGGGLKERMKEAAASVANPKNSERVNTGGPKEEKQKDSHYQEDESTE